MVRSGPFHLYDFVSCVGRPWCPSHHLLWQVQIPQSPPLPRRQGHAPLPRIITWLARSIAHEQCSKPQNTMCSRESCAGTPPCAGSYRSPRRTPWMRMRRLVCSCVDLSRRRSCHGAGVGDRRGTTEVVNKREASERRTPAIEKKRQARIRLGANLSVPLTCKMQSKRKRGKLRKGGEIPRIEKIRTLSTIL